MMTRDEVRRELREDEGDPRHGAERRRVHRALARRGPRRARDGRRREPHPRRGRAPPRPRAATRRRASSRRGPASRAARIRSAARRAGVPIVRDVPLARALHRLAEVGDEIPEELYDAAAALLAHLYGPPEAAVNARSTRCARAPARRGRGAVRARGARRSSCSSSRRSRPALLDALLALNLARLGDHPRRHAVRAERAPLRELPDAAPAHDAVPARAQRLLHAPRPLARRGGARHRGVRPRRRAGQLRGRRGRLRDPDARPAPRRREGRRARRRGRGALHARRDARQADGDRRGPARGRDRRGRGAPAAAGARAREPALRRDGRRAQVREGRRDRRHRHRRS